MHQICGHKRKDLLSNYDVGPEDCAMVWCMLYVVGIAIVYLPRTEWEEIAGIMSEFNAGDYMY